MGIVDFIKSIGQSQKENSAARMNASSENCPEEYVRTISFNLAFESLLSQDRFIARSDYKELVEQYRNLAQFYATLSIRVAVSLVINMFENIRRHV